MGKLEEVHRRAKGGWTKKTERADYLLLVYVGKMIRPFVIDIEWKNEKCFYLPVINVLTCADFFCDIECLQSSFSGIPIAICFHM